MNIEKDLKKMLSDETIDSETLNGIFVDLIFKHHVNKIPIESITLCDEVYGKAHSCLKEFKQMWLDILNRGEDPFVGVPWEDNPFQRLWDCFGDVYGNTLTAQMELFTFQKTKTSLEYKVLFIQHEEMLSYLGNINTSKSLKDVDNAIFYLGELKKITEGLIALEKGKIAA